MKKVDIDEHIKNKNFVKKRIEERIKKIEAELVEEIQQEEVVEEIVEDNDNKMNDEKVEDKAHDIEKSADHLKIEEIDVQSIHDEESNNRHNKSEEEPVKKQEYVPVKEKEIVKSVITKEEPEPIRKNEPENKIKDMKLYERLKARAEEYKRANDYFIHIQNQKQADDSRSKTITIIKALKEMEQGKEIDEFDLPNDITADYICDMTTQQRLENFKTIGKELTNKKKDIKEELENKIEQIKLLSKKEQEKKVRYPYLETNPR